MNSYNNLSDDELKNKIRNIRKFEEEVISKSRLENNKLKIINKIKNNNQHQKNNGIIRNLSLVASISIIMMLSVFLSRFLINTNDEKNIAISDETIIIEEDTLDNTMSVENNLYSNAISGIATGKLYPDYDKKENQGKLYSEWIYQEYETYNYNLDLYISEVLQEIDFDDIDLNELKVNYLEIILSDYESFFDYKRSTT